MNQAIRQAARPRHLMPWLIATSVLALAFLLGQRASPLWLGLLAAGIAGVVLLTRPVLGLPALMLAALVVPIEISTGTEVKLNAASLMVPVLLGIWLLDAVRRRRIRVAPSRANLPLALFLLAGLLSLLIGRATWDPIVPVHSNFLLVQLAQWAIFAFSALAFWLAGNLLCDEIWLRRLTQSFLLVGGLLAIAIVILGMGALVGRFSTVATIRAPFWILLAGLAGGQLLFERRALSPWRAFLIVVLLAVLVYAFRLQQEATSNWVGVGAVAGVLVWLRWPRLRLPIVVFFMALLLLGVLIPNIYQFAGGDAEWHLSGASRLVLIERVVGVAMRNPITGLGPAAYRPYANMAPLQYGQAFWIKPQINSHNNYVDIFAQTGLLGLGLFLWFIAEVGWLGWRLHQRYQQGVTAGYVNGMLAALAGIVVVMLFLDWFLPFVYNVGFPGFQASLLVWLFLGGLVAIEQWPPSSSQTSEPEHRR